MRLRSKNDEEMPTSQTKPISQRARKHPKMKQQAETLGTTETGEDGPGMSNPGTTQAEKPSPRVTQRLEARRRISRLLQ